MHWPAAQARRILSKYTDKGEGLAAVNTFKSLYKSSFGAMLVEEHLPQLSKQAPSRCWLKCDTDCRLGCLRWLPAVVEIGKQLCTDVDD